MWSSWGNSWGASWGASWGYQEGGGGPGKSSYGWANERAAHERALQEMERVKHAQSTLRQTQQPEALKLADMIDVYQAGDLDISDLVTQQQILRAQINARDEFAKEIKMAQNAINAYLKDEQEAIDALFADFEANIKIVGVTFNA
jgi:hypothetical protein